MIEPTTALAGILAGTIYVFYSHSSSSQRRLRANGYALGARQPIAFMRRPPLAGRNKPGIYKMSDTNCFRPFRQLSNELRTRQPGYTHSLDVAARSRRSEQATCKGEPFAERPRLPSALAIALVAGDLRCIELPTKSPKTIARRGACRIHGY